MIGSLRRAARHVYGDADADHLNSRAWRATALLQMLDRSQSLLSPEGERGIGERAILFDC